MDFGDNPEQVPCGRQSPVEGRERVTECKLMLLSLDPATPAVLAAEINNSVCTVLYTSVCPYIQGWLCLCLFE